MAGYSHEEPDYDAEGRLTFSGACRDALKRSRGDDRVWLVLTATCGESSGPVVMPHTDDVTDEAQLIEDWPEIVRAVYWRGLIRFAQSAAELVRPGWTSVETSNDLELVAPSVPASRLERAASAAAAPLAPYQRSMVRDLLA